MSSIKKTCRARKQCTKHLMSHTCWLWPWTCSVGLSHEVTLCRCLPCGVEHDSEWLGECLCGGTQYTLVLVYQLAPEIQVTRCLCQNNSDCLMCLVCLICLVWNWKCCFCLMNLLAYLCLNAFTIHLNLP